MQGDLEPVFTELVALEEQVADAIESGANPADKPRVYEFHPTRFPELPAIWNMIDDGSYEIDSTATAKDIVVITVTIGVLPGDLGGVMGQLLRIRDEFCRIVDPALWLRPPLGGTVREAKRVVSRTGIDDSWDNDGQGPFVMCFDQLLQLKLPKVIAPTS